MVQLSAKRPSDRESRFAWLSFVSRRYVLTRRKDKSNTASLLSIGGLALGCAVLITVISVMNALQEKTIQGILSFNNFQVRLDDPDLSLSLTDPREAEALREACGEIRSITPFQDMQVMAWSWYSQARPVWIRGMDPEGITGDLAGEGGIVLRDGSLDVSAPDSIVLGRYLARYLDVVVGDRITVTAFETRDGIARPVRRDLDVTGIMEVGYRDYDTAWALVSLDTAASLAGSAAGRSTGFVLSDRDSDLRARRVIADTLAARSGRDTGDLEGRIHTWRTFNSAIFGALRVEKLMMFVVVGLIFIVVAVNIYHALRRSVLEKTEDIGVLRAVGASPGSIQLIFIGEGFIIGTLGACIGLALGVLLATQVDLAFKGIQALVDGFASLARSAGIPLGGGSVSLFYMDEVPSRLHPAEAAGIALFAWASALVASWAASRRVSRILPAEILRSE